jgi:ABC-type multidrug transport system ATPase subunit
LISHNLASIQVADRIALLNDGRVEAVGTDQELKRTSGLYRRLHEIHYHVEPSQRPGRPHSLPAASAFTRSPLT